MSTASPRPSPDQLIDRTSPGWHGAILLLGRILIGGIFVQSGFGKLMGLDAFATGLARAARRPRTGAGVDRGERRIFRRPRHRLWVDDALRRTGDDRLRDRRDADLAPLLGAPHPDRPVCQERGDYQRLLIPLRHRWRPLQPGALVAQQQIARYSLLPPSCLSLANTASTLSSSAGFFSSGSGSRRMVVSDAGNSVAPWASASTGFSLAAR